MAGIKGITIRGIRSFGPENADEQTVFFTKPLTLILGQNGCGKTTIIESLKYVITGQFPPGSKNECFVYDAKVNRTQEVKGQVKLLCYNTKGIDLTVSRSMQVTWKQNKSQFKTLDSSISRLNIKKEPVEISARCADIDQVMFEELGVSKAIINSVIFCHQEDSAWPLDEGKKVKDRFDEIFDADKYSACFDRLTKIRKEYATEIKLLEQSVSHLTEKKGDLDKKKLEVINTEARISETEINLMEMQKEMKPITDKLKNIEEIEKNVVKYETAKEKAKMKLENSISQQNELKKNIKKVFTGTSNELTSSIQNYEKLTKNKQQEMNLLKDKIASLKLEITNITNKISANEIKFNKLILLESQNQERVDQRNEMLKNCLSDIGKTPLSEINSEEEATSFISQLQQDVQSKKTDLKSAQDEAEREEKKYQKLVDECRDSLSRHKQKIVSKEAELRELGKQIKKLENDICDAEKSKKLLEVHENLLKAAELDYQKASEEINTESLSNYINHKEKDLEKLENELDGVNKNIDLLQSQRAKLAEINIIQENLTSKEKMLNTLKNKHKQSLLELLGRVPESNFAMAVNDCEVTIREDVDNAEKNLKNKRHEKAVIEANEQNARDLLKSKKAELSAAEDKIYKICKSQSYEAVLAKTDAEIAKLQEEKNELASSQCIISKYKKQLSEDNNCPLCCRNFDSQSEVTDLISSLSMKIKNVPVQLERVSEELSRASAKRDDLLALKSVQEKLVNLKEIEIPKIEQKVANFEEKYQEIASAEEDIKMSLMEPVRKLDIAKQLATEMPLLDRYTLETKTLTKDLEKLKESCTNVNGELNYDDTVSLQKELRGKITTLRNNLKSDQTKLNQHMKKMQTLTDKKNKSKEEYLNLQRKVQEIYNLQERLSQNQCTEAKLRADVQSLTGLTSSLEVQLKEQELEKNSAVNKLKNAIELKRNQLEKIKNMVDKIQAIQKEITQHLKKNITAEINLLKEKHTELDTSRDDKNMEIATDQVTVEELFKELSEQELFKRDLEDNLKLRQFESDAAKYEKELEEIITHMGGIDVQIISSKEKLMRKHSKLFSESCKLNGSIDEMKKILQSLKQELQLPTNKNLENKFREKFYELQILKAMDKDIKDYAAAMDKCLLQFHKEKMENINLIIREMWHKIYRGNDIDYIQIKTEGESVTQTTSKRRKFEYRVVQCKNGVEIDMRGRCSAGQKVLACLIIRLALAETFSSRFGVLALDEPTTNLDEENEQSLSSALAEIVTERMRQKNFMFIIITHDRKFIESLGGIEKVTHYYEVSRNREGKSRVKKEKFN